MPSNVPIGPGTRVTLKFALRLTNGEEVDSTGEKGATFEVGDGNLLPGFERAIFGLKPGAAESFSIAAENGFGEHREENTQRIPKSYFPKNMEISEGLLFSFADNKKAELPGLISRIEEDTVVVDFNHPLAGREICFDVEIIDVEQISQDIFRSGSQAASD